MLLESFEDSLKVLQELADKNKRRVDKLGHVCLKQEKEHAARIGELEGLYAVSIAPSPNALSPHSLNIGCISRVSSLGREDYLCFHQGGPSRGPTGEL